MNEAILAQLTDGLRQMCLDASRPGVPKVAEYIARMLEKNRVMNQRDSRTGSRGTLACAGCVVDFQMPGSCGEAGSRRGNRRRCSGCAFGIV